MIEVFDGGSGGWVKLPKRWRVADPGRDCEIIRDDRKYKAVLDGPTGRWALLVWHEGRQRWLRANAPRTRKALLRRLADARTR